MKENPSSVLEPFKPFANSQSEGTYEKKTIGASNKETEGINEVSEVQDSDLIDEGNPSHIAPPKSTKFWLFFGAGTFLIVVVLTIAFTFFRDETKTSAVPPQQIGNPGDETSFDFEKIKKLLGKGQPISPLEARAKVGEFVLVELKIQSANRPESEVLFLNSEPDYRHPENFVIFFRPEQATAFLNREGTDDKLLPIDDLVDQTVQVAGRVTEYSPNPNIRSVEINVIDIRQIKVLPTNNFVQILSD